MKEREAEKSEGKRSIEGEGRKDKQRRVKERGA